MPSKAASIYPPIKHLTIVNSYYPVSRASRNFPSFLYAKTLVLLRLFQFRSRTNTAHLLYRCTSICLTAAVFMNPSIASFKTRIHSSSAAFFPGAGYGQTLVFFLAWYLSHLWIFHIPSLIHNLLLVVSSICGIGLKHEILPSNAIWSLELGVSTCLSLLRVTGLMLFFETLLPEKSNLAL